MSRVRDYLAVLDGRCAVLDGEHPGDGLLQSMLVHAAFADSVVVESEFKLLAKLLPGQTDREVHAWINAESARPMDYDGLLNAFPSSEEREDLVRLAELLAQSDDRGDDVEDAFVDVLRAMVMV